MQYYFDNGVCKTTPKGQVQPGLRGSRLSNTSCPSEALGHLMEENYYFGGQLSSECIKSSAYGAVRTERLTVFDCSVVSVREQMQHWTDPAST